MNYFATLGAILLGSTMTAGWTWWRDRGIAAQTEVREAAALREARRARRYADQRTAYVDFAQAGTRAEWRRLDVLEQHDGDADMTSLGFTGPLREVLDTLTVVQLLGAHEVADAAQLYSYTLHRFVFHGGSEIENADAAYKYRSAMRTDLQVDDA